MARGRVAIVHRRSRRTRGAAAMKARWAPGTRASGPGRVAGEVPQDLRGSERAVLACRRLSVRRQIRNRRGCAPRPAPGSPRRCSPPNARSQTRGIDSNGCGSDGRPSAPHAIARHLNRLLAAGDRQRNLHACDRTLVWRPRASNQQHVCAGLADVHVGCEPQARRRRVGVVLVSDRRRDLDFRQRQLRQQGDRGLDDDVQRVDAGAIGKHGNRGLERRVVFELQHA